MGPKRNSTCLVLCCLVKLTQQTLVISPPIHEEILNCGRPRKGNTLLNWDQKWEEVKV